MVRSAFTAIATFVMAVVGGSAFAVTVATPEHGILWQTVRDPARPIEWRWEGDDVTAARVTIASPMEKKTDVPVIVTRIDGSLYGSIEMPGERVAGKEYLYDVTVELMAGEAVKETLNARLVYLPEAAEVVPADKITKRYVEGAALYSYNVQWSEDAVEPAKVTVQGTADRTEIDLPGSSGYGYFTEKGLGDLGGSRLLATLDFGGGDAVWSNYLRLHGGLIMIFR